MQRIRRVEEALIAEYHPADEMRCPIHFCVGQEASPAALGLTLIKGDSIYSHYRSHGYFLAKGSSMQMMVAEFYGKVTGSNKGMAGSMELADHSNHFHSGAIVGGVSGLAVGHAFAQKFLQERTLSVAVFGDGAMDEGVNYEAINLAVLHSLPVIFLCENNGYAAHTSLSSRSGARSIHGRAAAFGIDTAVLNDRDPDKLRIDIARLVEGVRKTSRPLFIEVSTYRLCSHVGPNSDEWMKYRPAEELASHFIADPLIAFRRALICSGLKNHLELIDEQIDIEINEAIAAAKIAPFPNGAWSLSITSAETYDPVVSNLLDGAVAEFLGAQNETKLGPY
jgi:TPP-dependent pyruvate/acetoin dehydrogenase alpha subunit